MSTLDMIREMLVDQFQLDPVQVTPEATLEGLNIDSLSAVEFMFLLEEKFNVTAPMGRVEIKTVQDVGNEIDRLIAAQHGAKKAPQQAA
ncbi:MAG: acyl carrier protein [Burkholderiales bacterium]